MARACSQDISSGCSDQIEIAALPAAVEVKEQAKLPKLGDYEINFAQKLLKVQFSKLKGLQSTLYQVKELSLTENDVINKLQIIHCSSRHHWLFPLQWYVRLAR